MLVVFMFLAEMTIRGLRFESVSRNHLGGAYGRHEGLRRAAPRPEDVVIMQP